MIIKVINIPQFEIRKMRVHIKKIHIKEHKNTVNMHQNNGELGSVTVRVRVF